MIRTRLDRKLSSDSKVIEVILQETCQWYIETNKDRYYSDQSIQTTSSKIAKELQDLLKVLGASQTWLSIKVDQDAYTIEVRVNVSYNGFYTFGFTTHF